MKRNTLILTTVVALGAMFGYWYFVSGNETEPTLRASAPTNQAQMQFEKLIGELRPISFDTDIFSDPRFNALVDLTTPIAPESFGRLDPLAPFSGEAARVSEEPSSPSGEATPASESESSS